MPNLQIRNSSWFCSYHHHCCRRHHHRLNLNCDLLLPLNYLYSYLRFVSKYKNQFNTKISFHNELPFSKMKTTTILSYQSQHSTCTCSGAHWPMETHKHMAAPGCVPASNQNILIFKPISPANNGSRDLYWPIRWLQI